MRIYKFVFQTQNSTTYCPLLVEPNPEPRTFNYQKQHRNKLHALWYKDVPSNPTMFLCFRKFHCKISIYLTPVLFSSIDTMFRHTYQNYSL